MPDRRIPAVKLKESAHYAITSLKTVIPDIEELIRRRQYEVADGYPASSTGGGTNTGTVSDPTARSAMTGNADDPTGKAIDTVLNNLAEIGRLAGELRNAHYYVFQTEDQRGRQSQVAACSACEEPVTMVGEDRLWSGLDRKCYDRSRTWRKEQADQGKDSSLEAFRRMVQREKVENKGKRTKELVKA